MKKSAELLAAPIFNFDIGAPAPTTDEICTAISDLMLAKERLQEAIKTNRKLAGIVLSVVAAIGLFIVATGWYVGPAAAIAYLSRPSHVWIGFALAALTLVLAIADKINSVRIALREARIAELGKRINSLAILTEFYDQSLTLGGFAEADAKVSEYLASVVKLGRRPLIMECDGIASYLYGLPEETKAANNGRALQRLAEKGIVCLGTGVRP